MFAVFVPKGKQLMLQSMDKDHPFNDLEVSFATVWTGALSFRSWDWLNKRYLQKSSLLKGAGWVSWLGLTSSSEWGLMKTNDLTGSRGWDQGWRFPLPLSISSFRRLMRAETVIALYYLPPGGPWNLVASVCSPPVGPWWPHDTDLEGIASELGL